MDSSEAFRAFRIHSEGRDGHRADIESLTLNDLSDGEVVIRAAYSSVNYKDALAGTGKGKILQRFPLVGGIDVAGHVIASTDPDFREGDAVLCTGCGLSEDRDGGYSEVVRLQGKSTIALPTGLDLREAMIIGTAGFTAALSLLRMETNGQRPEQGPIVVTGATGGVGMMAIDILTRAGYEAHAITSKFDRIDDLTALGATQVISAKDLHWGQRPLERASWAGAIDNVGDEMLAGLTRQVGLYGNIASCGLAGGHRLATTVMPFILRGVSLLGVSSNNAPRDIREAVWQKLANEWRPAHLERICTRTVTLSTLTEVFEPMLDGQSFGRTLVDLLESKL